MLNRVTAAALLLGDSSDSGHTVSRMPHLQGWLEASGVQLPTPAAKDIKALAAAAVDNKRLRKQLEALREAELELAAREAEENAQNFAMLVRGSACDGGVGLWCVAWCEKGRLQQQVTHR